MKNQTKSRAPTHRLYTVNGPDDNARWTEIGAGWTSRDEQGFTLLLDALPIDGRIVMREIAKADQGGQE